MRDKCSQTGRFLAAKLSGEAKHHARWRDLSGDEEAAAVAALRELAGGRSDLLAEVADLAEGFHEGEPYEPIGRQITMLCRKAKADLGAIPACRRGAAPEGHSEAAADVRGAAQLTRTCRASVFNGLSVVKLLAPLIGVNFGPGWAVLGV